MGDACYSHSELVWGCTVALCFLPHGPLLAGCFAGLNVLWASAADTFDPVGSSRVGSHTRQRQSTRHSALGTGSTLDSGGTNTPCCTLQWCVPPRGRTMTMYHGTTSQNARSIMRNGFWPSRTGMLGEGVYVSTDIDKARAYGQCILVLEVQLGKTKKIDSQAHPMRTSWHDHGYDSAWVPAHCGMVRSGLTETCVFDPQRIRVLSLMWCNWKVVCLILPGIFQLHGAKASVQQLGAT